MTPKPSSAVSELFAQAIRFHQAGQLAEAEQRYRQALAIDPRHAGSLHLLGIVAHQAGRHDLAVGLIGQAISINGEVAGFHASLGAVLRAQGKPDDAAASYRKALDLNPDDAEAHNYFANVLIDCGKPDDAVTHYRKACALKPGYAAACFNLAVVLAGQAHLNEAAAQYRQAILANPNYPEAHNNLGIVLMAQGKFDEAAAQYKIALTLRPGYTDAYCNFGNVLMEQDKLDEAATQYRQALALKPDYAEVCSNLGAVLKAQGKLDEAVAQYQHALSINPNYAEAHYNLANVLQIQGRLDDALAHYQTALSLRPNYPESHNNFGNALKTQGKLADAEAQYRRALALLPDYPEAHNNLGNVLKDSGRLDDALQSYERACSLRPEFLTASNNLLMSLHYSTRHSEADFFAQARAYARHLGQDGPSRVFANTPDPQRTLRIGYVSADFRDHPVGYFLDRVLPAHAKAAVAVTCYSNNAYADATTARLRAAAGQWRDIAGTSDAAAADLIARDGIDILVDLAGHTADNRLRLFALKPAPVQMSWLGYFGTTGLTAMDYVLADRFVAPPHAERFYTEKIWRMPDSYLCFAPPDLDVPVARRPRADDEPIILGCFNNWAKATPATIALWAEVLSAMPAARLFLKTKTLGDEAGRAGARAGFAAHGIGSERLILEGASPRAELLAAYNRVDIALDPLPFGGGTTTAEALWMGVPVVTLRGDRFVGRVSESIMAAVGVGDLVASDRAGYVKAVADLASDRVRLAGLHNGLRQMVEGSPICDGPRFVASLEAAYRGMWNEWCATRAMENTKEKR
ncbi:MAG: tetratricopeptide repeat protein [Pseudolabrys sp.]|nr:tetratricopeptide repeat protein [Pseudolabrys sp.]